MIENKIVVGGMTLAMSLFAQTPTDGSELWGRASNLSALGIVAIVAVFIVVKMLPDLHQKFIIQSEVFSDTVKELNVHHSETIKKMNENHAMILDKVHERSTLVQEEFVRLREHCAAKIAQ